jgi:cytochrome c551/c552
MTNNLHRYENDLPKYLLIGIIVGFIALMLTIVAYTIGRHHGQTASPVATSTATSGGSPGAQGQALFTENGCGGCHTFAPAGATGTIGPDLATAAQAAKADNNMPLDAYIQQSIIDPHAYISSGYTSGVMPTTYAGKLSQAQIQALVAYIAAGNKP